MIKDMKKEEVIKDLKLIPHIEGGYFKETVHGDIKYKDSDQYLYSSIIFLLGKDDISHLHDLKEDELWYYQGGDNCLIVDIDVYNGCKINYVEIGLNNGNKLVQYLVKKGHIFGSRCKGENFALVGCMVSPSFKYEHFRLVKKEEVEGKISNEDFEKISDMFAE